MTPFFIQIPTTGEYWKAPYKGTTHNIKDAHVYREVPVISQQWIKDGTLRVVPINEVRYTLAPTCRNVLEHMQKNGSITAIDAMTTYQMTSATLARRICDLEEFGWKIKRDRRVYPITGRRYTAYMLQEN